MVKLKALQGELDTKAMSAADMLALIGDFMYYNSGEGKHLWDLLVALRGPDVGLADISGMARTDFEDGRDPLARKARELRKHSTGAILRGRMFPKGLNGNMKMNSDPNATVALPPKAAWDHYDAHVAEACDILSIDYTIGGKPAHPSDSELDDGMIINIPGVPMSQYFSNNGYMLARVKGYNADTQRGTMRFQDETWEFKVSFPKVSMMTPWISCWHRSGSEIFAVRTVADPFEPLTWKNLHPGVANGIRALREWRGDGMPHGMWAQQKSGTMTWKEI